MDISHPNFEDHIQVVKNTLHEIGAGDKPVFKVFNKTDAYRYAPKDEYDLTEKTRENYTLEEVKTAWIAQHKDIPAIFISAKNKTNIDKFRTDVYGMVAEIHAGRYPFNNFLW